MSKKMGETNQKTILDKKIIIAIITIVAIIIISIIIYVIKKSNYIEPIIDDENSVIKMSNTTNAKIENGIKENTSIKIKEEKNIDGIKFTNIKLTGKDDISTFTATATNTTNNTFKEKFFTISFLDDAGIEYSSIQGFLKTLKPNESTEINTMVSFDETNASDIKISFVDE